MFRSIGGRVSLGVLCLICLSLLIIPFSVIKSGAQGEGGEGGGESPGETAPQPPFLQDIGNHTVDLGNTLAITLDASDPDNDPLTFSVSPLPLPDNSSLEQLSNTTAVFTFTPTAFQLGSFPLTFIVSDGGFTAQETVTITVTVPPGSITELSGQLLDTNDFVLGTETPIEGATISLLNTNCSGQVCSTTTGSDGRFHLTHPGGIPSGKQTVDMDMTNVVNAPPGVTYAGFREEISLIAGVNNVITRPFFIPRIDPAGVANITRATGGQVVNPNLNVTADIPANALLLNGQPVNDVDISLSEVPDGLAPANLPRELEPGLLLTLQPVGVTYTSPVQLTVPNTEGLPVGNKLDLWSLDAQAGTFAIVGEGEVMADGMIHTISGGIPGNSWHAFLSSTVTPDNSGNNNTSNLPPTTCIRGGFGSSATLCSGDLMDSHTLSSYRSLGQSRALRFVYSSADADPQPTMSFNVTIPVRAAVPQTVSTELEVAGIMQPNEIFTDTTGLNENVDETIRQVVQFDASGFQTGRYPYEITATNNYPQTSISSIINGHVLVINQQDSEFGAGWTLDGLQRLTLDANQNAIITQGDGSAQYFNYVLSGSNLQAHWRFDDQTNPTMDETGKHDGFLQQNASFTTAFTPPIPSNIAAMNLTAPGDHVIVAGAPELDIPSGSPATIALWVKQTEARDTFHIYGKRTGCGTMNYQLARDSTHLLHFVSNFQHFSAGQDMPLNQWTHMGITYDGATTLTIYLDGVPVAQNSNYTMGPPVISNLRIGSSGTCAAANTFPGQLDEMYLFDRELSASEIVNLKDATAPATAGYFAPAGEFSSLVQNANGTFTRTMKDGTQIHFDTFGRHTSTVDRNGNTTTYGYNAQGRLATITDPANLVTTLTYGADGKLDTILDPAGRTTQFMHDSAGNLIRITDPDTTSRQFVYDTRHRMTSNISKRNHQTSYVYNFAGRAIRAIWPDGSRRTMVPKETIGLPRLSAGVGTQSNPAPFKRPGAAVASFRDGNQNKTKVELDRFGAATKTTDPLNRVTMIDRDANANPIKVTQPNGEVIDMTYDGRGNLLTTTSQSITATTTFTYDPTFNQITSTTDPNNNTTTIQYDATGNPVTVTDTQMNQTTMAYNTQGLLTSVTDALMNTTQFTYDTKGNLLTTTDPLMNTTTLGYDAAGNVTSTTDAENKITQFMYDAMNRLTQVIDPDSGVTQYAYDNEGNLTTVTDAKNNITTFEYDTQNRLIKTTDPLNQSETFEYDNDGNLIKTTDRRMQVIDFEYDEANQLIKKTLPAPAGGPGTLVTDFTYDSVGNLLTVIDPDSQVTFEYDLAGRLTKAQTTGSPNQPDVTIDYTYDVNGNRLTMVDSLTGSTSYMYDTINRLTKITNPSSLAIDFNYDVLSRCTLATLPNGTSTTYMYDNNSRLTSLAHNMGATTLSSFGYGYDKVGNRTSLNVVRSAVWNVNSPLNYVYDNLYRVTQATRPLTGQADETFTYDLVGNRVSRDGQGSNSTVNQANQLLNDTVFTYSYDANGNVIQKVEITNSATTDYTYDAENQLIRIDFPDSTNAQYRYDGLGRRIEKDVNGTVTRYVYDNEDILLEFDGANVLQARYTHGLGIDEPLVMERNSQSFFYHADGLGSIMDLTDTNGAIVQSYVYDSFGQIIQTNGSLTNPYTYTGRELDAESGLYFYRHRYYDPTSGRFLNEDPLGIFDSLNLYPYVLSNPVNFIDPWGLQLGPPPWFNPIQPGIDPPLRETSPGFQLQLLRQKLNRLKSAREKAVEELRKLKKICSKGKTERRRRRRISALQRYIFHLRREIKRLEGIIENSPFNNNENGLMI